MCRRALVLVLLVLAGVDPETTTETEWMAADGETEAGAGTERAGRRGRECNASVGALPSGTLLPSGLFEVRPGATVRGGDPWPHCGPQATLVPRCDGSVANEVAAGPLVVAADGGLVDAEGTRFVPGSFWEDAASGRTFACACQSPYCVFKCCDFGRIVEGRECVPVPAPVPQPSLFGDRFPLVVRNPCPFGKYRLDPEGYEEDQYDILESGDLRLVWSGAVYLKGNFCVEGLGSQPGVYQPFLCFPSEEEESESRSAASTLYPLCLLVSVPFLIATLLVYVAVGELRNVHGLTLMSYIAALLVAYCALATVQLRGHALPYSSCVATAFIIYFAFLASFFWLNVMCLDIWWTFSGYRHMRGSVKEREHKKFIIYSLYCWGSPLIMLIICMIMDLHPGIPDTVEKPGFGKQKCWFETPKANFYYFLGPIAILILCNIILFVLTSLKIRQVKRGNKILKKQDSRRHHHHDDEENNAQRFNLYLKLFLVMGVNWIMEVISFVAGGPDEWWYVTDIANTLQGVLIFIIFVWKDRIRRLLLERLCPGRAAARATSASTASSTRMTPIRQGSVLSNSRNSTSLAGNATSATAKEQHNMKNLVPPPSTMSEESDFA